jgi:hypothetical protein
LFACATADQSWLSGTEGSTAAQGAVQLSGVEGRLQHLEYAVKTLADSVERALEAISVAYPRGGDVLRPSSPTRGGARSKDVSNRELYVGPSHSFSFLNDVPFVIDRVVPTPASALARDSAHSEIQRLSSTLTIAQEAPQTREGAMEFRVPSKAAGYRMISRKAFAHPHC